MSAVHTVCSFCFSQLTASGALSWSQCEELFLIPATGSVLLHYPKVPGSLHLRSWLGPFRTGALPQACGEVLCIISFHLCQRVSVGRARKWGCSVRCTRISDFAKYCQILLLEYVPFLPPPKIVCCQNFRLLPGRLLRSGILLLSLFEVIK